MLKIWYLTIIQFSIGIVIWIVQWVWIQIVIGILSVAILIVLNLISIVVIDTGVYYPLIRRNVLRIVVIWIVSLVNHVDLSLRWCKYHRWRNYCGLSHPSVTIDDHCDYKYKDDESNHYEYNGTRCRNSIFVIVVIAIKAKDWTGAIYIAAIVLALLAVGITRWTHFEVIFNEFNKK